jgi:16S rRNA (guanine966-N2)-methyltransferase
MRIISGTLKGKSIKFLKNSTTRPLKDSVRESIFNILKHSNLINIEIENSNILDLYSGIGSFGLESISRGAKEVTFIEQDKKASNILKENLINFSVTNKATLINSKIEDFLNRNKRKKYNIFFLDPPFTDKEFIQSLDTIKNNKIYEKKHIVVIHRERKSDDDLDKFINITAAKHYGRSKIIFGVFS